MTQLKQGRLVVKETKAKEKQVYVQVATRKGGAVEMRAEAHLSKDLREESVDKLNGLEVE
jgi:hypothetical protein